MWTRLYRNRKVIQKRLMKQSAPEHASCPEPVSVAVDISCRVCLCRLGNTYKYQAGNRMNALLWFKHLSAACQSNRQQVWSSITNSCTHAPTHTVSSIVHTSPLYPGASQFDVIRVSDHGDRDWAQERGTRSQTEEDGEEEEEDWRRSGSVHCHFPWPLGLRFCPRPHCSLPRHHCLNQSTRVYVCVCDSVCVCLFWMYWLLNKDLHHSSKCPWRLFFVSTSAERFDVSAVSQTDCPPGDSSNPLLLFPFLRGYLFFLFVLPPCTNAGPPHIFLNDWTPVCTLKSDESIGRFKNTFFPCFLQSHF